MHTLAELRSGKLKGITRLQISEGLSVFPEEIYALADTLEVLDLSHNRLSSLPSDLHRLKHLKIAFFSNNYFTEVPKVFKSCKNLYMLGFKANAIEVFDEDVLPLSISWLILTDNKIKVLPKSLGKLHKLQKCALAGNQIKAIPSEISECKNLELLRLSANNIEEIPSALLNLPKLSWLAFSGNPCSGKQEFSLPQIEYVDLSVEELLGEGASGEIYKAYSKELDKDVAFKLFKGSVTSDGYARDEMNAYMGTGEHENLIKVLAKLEADEKLGLILELIPKDYINLGLPPSLQTCTRDTFEEGSSFTLQAIFKIAKAMASASAHLHDRGLMHGDLYAHNILINDEDETYLGDFGAASFYDKGESLYEKIEVRAFGCLLDDLLQRCPETTEVKYKKLQLIVQMCMDINVGNRPRFSNIATGLEGSDHSACFLR